MKNTQISFPDEEAQSQERAGNTEAFFGAYNRVYNHPAQGEAQVGIEGKNSISPEKQRYVLNDVAIEEMKRHSRNPNIHEYFKNKITSSDRRFAQTAERDTHRILTKDEVTNESQKQKVVDDFYANSAMKKANIGKILLAKMNNDMDMQSIMEGLYDEKSDWQKMPPEKVQAEIFNRLKDQREENKPEYNVLLKLIKKIEESEAELREYSKTKRARENQAEKDIHDKHFNALVDSSKELEDFEKDRFEASVREVLNPDIIAVIQPYIKKNPNATIIDVQSYLQSKVNDTPHPERKDTNALEKIKDLQSLREKLGLANTPDTPIRDFTKKAEKYFKTKDEFAIKKVENRDITQKTLEEYFITAKEYPLTTLALLTDEKKLRSDIEQSEVLRDSIRKELEEKWKESHGGRDITEKVKKEINNEVEERIDVELKLFDKDAKEIKGDLLNSIKGSLGKNGTDLEAQAIYEETIHTIKRNKSDIQSIYDPDYDSLNPNRKHLPTNFQPSDGFQNDALNVLKSSIYLATTKIRSSEVYETLYSGEGEKELFSNAMDREIEAKKPSEEKIVDIQNAYLYLTDVANSKLDMDSADNLIDSEVFKDSTVLNSKDKEALKQVGSSLAKHLEVQEGESLYGALPKDDLSLAITEGGQLNLASILEKQSTFEGQGLHDIGSLAKSILTKLFNNNKVIYEFSMCMTKAKNPTTSVETPSSMGRGCLEELRGNIDKEIQKAEGLIDKNLNSPIGASNFAVIFLQIMNILQQVRDDEITTLIAMMQKEINEKKDYIATAETEVQATGRYLGVEAKDNSSSYTISEEGFGKRIAKTAEDEFVMKDIAEINGEEMSIHQNFSDEAIKNIEKHLDLKDIANKDELLAELGRIEDKLIEKKKELVELGDKLSSPDTEGKTAEEIAKRRKEIAEEYTNLEEDIDSLESDKRKVMYKLDDSQMEKDLVILENEIKSRKKELIEKKEELEKGLENKTLLPADIVAKTKEIEDLEQEITPLEVHQENLQGEIKKHLNREKLDKELYEIVKKMKNGEKIELDGVNGDNSYALAYALHKHRESLYENKINAELNEDKRVAIKIGKEIKTLDRHIPVLQKNAMDSKETLNKILTKDVRQKYDVKLSKEVLREVEKEGLTPKTIGKIVNEAENQIAKKTGVSENNDSKQLFVDLTSYAEVKKMWKEKKKNTSPRDYNNLSAFQQAVEKSDPKSMEKLRKSNSFYVGQIDKIGGNKELIEAGQGVNGYTLERIETLSQKKNKTEKENVLLAKYMEYSEEKEISSVTSEIKKQLAQEENVGKANQAGQKLKSANRRRKYM